VAASRRPETGSIESAKGGRRLRCRFCPWKCPLSSTAPDQSWEELQQHVALEHAEEFGRIERWLDERNWED
jgi:hypothetical protein